ncbi:hypothetical protein [Streptomyces sp. NPDC058254]|uniref:hypothetical protein n=1 Tax=Streptomyces sp. NPDC058254 TaxID=3346406 RepID=UPI0036E28BB6
MELHAPGGPVAVGDAIRCSCLLAPACVHRAAAATLAPIADAPATALADAPTSAPEDAPTAALADASTSASADAPASALADSPASAPTDTSDRPSLPGHAQPSRPGPAQPEVPPPSPAAEPSVPPPPSTEAPTPTPTTPAQTAAAEALWQAAGLVLEAGVDGAGAVLQAGLLRAAHSARLAALPRPAAAAIRTVNGLRAARAAEPDHRTSELADALKELLATAHGLRHPGTPEAHAALRGTARRAYAPGGSLRLYGLFTEPVLTSTGHAGVVTWTADAAGRLCTVPDMAPGGPTRARTAGDRAVRMGDTALTHRDLARAGLVVSGAIVPADKRLGAGRSVRAAAATGADWTDEPLAALWSVPVAEQAARALATGQDLLFLDVTLTGVAREAGGDCLLAECGGLTVRLTSADDHPELAHRENLALLATAPGTWVRAVARLVPAGHPRSALLAVSLPTGRYDLGLDRLQRQDVTPRTPPTPTPASLPEPAPIPVLPTPSAPLHILRRRTEQVVVAGRHALTYTAPTRQHATAPRGTTAPPTTTPPDTALLRAVGLSTAAELLDALRRSAAERGRDGFGRLGAADTDAFARVWLATARYLDEASIALCREAWRT